MRLFAGIALDAATRTTCAQAQDSLRRAGFDGRFEAPEKLHVTLAFLGNVEDARLAEIVAALESVASLHPPIDVVFDKVAAFPNERRPRIVYVGARDQGAAFRTLAGNVREAYVSLGFTFHDDSVAHVTIARVKEPRRPLPLVEISPQPLQIDELTLFESVFDKEKNTSRYVTSATSRLSGERAVG